MGLTITQLNLRRQLTTLLKVNGWLITRRPILDPNRLSCNRKLLNVTFNRDVILMGFYGSHPTMHFT